MEATALNDDTQPKHAGAAAGAGKQPIARESAPNNTSLSEPVATRSISLNKPGGHADRDVYPIHSYAVLGLQDRETAEGVLAGPIDYPDTSAVLESTSTEPESLAVGVAGAIGSAHQVFDQQADGASQTSNLSVDSDWDKDSAIGTEYGSSTDSVRSSVYEYVEENGRRYHKYKEGKYYFPNDEMEQDRLDLQHHLFLLTLDGKLHLAPLGEVKGGIHRALDIATGTGNWAIDFASAYPSATVIGTDLSPIQPHYVPSNCRFEVDDAEDPWLYSYQFDYIHGRMLASCFNSHLTVFRSAFQALRPGGWIEMQDFEFPFRSFDDSSKGTAFEKWSNLILAGTSRMGRNFQKTSGYAKDFTDCGFVDVKKKELVWPIGTWAKGQKLKILGEFCRQDAMSGLQGWSMLVLTRGLGMSPSDVDSLLTEMKNEINSKKLHIYVVIHFVYGRKPE